MLREMRLLQHFQHENVLSIRDIMMPPPGRVSDWKDVYLVTELLDTDLHYIINSKQALTDDHIQYFVYQATCSFTNHECLTTGLVTTGPVFDDHPLFVIRSCAA